METTNHTCRNQGSQLLYVMCSQFVNAAKDHAQIYIFSLQQAVCGAKDTW